MKNTCIWTFMGMHDFNDEKKEAVVRFLKEAGVLDCFESAVRAWFDKEEATAEAASEERLNGGQPTLDYRLAKAAIPVYTVEETRKISKPDTARHPLGQSDIGQKYDYEFATGVIGMLSQSYGGADLNNMLRAYYPHISDGERNAIIACLGYSPFVPGPAPEAPTVANVADDGRSADD